MLPIPEPRPADRLLLQKSLRDRAYPCLSLQGRKKATAVLKEAMLSAGIR
jgi:hypothetical protein